MSRAPAVYLDYNATAPIRPEAQDAAVCALRIGANPSSVHGMGRVARAAVEMARAEVARLVNVRDEQVIFTSGGSEVNRIAVEAGIANGCRRPIVLATEHDSVVRPAMAAGHWTEIWPVNGQGVADLDWLTDRLKRWDAKDGAPFVAIALANSETGVIQPVAEAADIVHAAGGALHVDAVQAAGKIAVDVSALGADTLTLSGHKLGAPQGVGALVVIPGGPVKARRLFMGAHAMSVGQELGIRPGTENVSGIAGFGAAATAALRDLPHAADQAPWRDAVAERLKDEGALIAGEGAPRLPGVLCAVTDGFGSELQVMMCDLDGVMVSAGSACSSGKVTNSTVLTAMGMMGLAGFAVRASGGWATVEDDWSRFADVWVAARERHARRRSVA
jgi:cysteine desulfurase